MDRFVNLFKEDDTGTVLRRQRWSGRATFILAAIGSAIGLGNFWRFPYLCYKWGGALFFIPYLLSLFFLGLPMMLLELSIGQLFQRGDIGVFRTIHPRLMGVGLASVFSAFAINIFYTVVIAWSVCYFVASFYNPLPWSVERTKAYQSEFCLDGKDIQKNNSPCQPLQECPDELYVTAEYFYKDLLHTYTEDCKPFDTSNFIAGGDSPTEFSWQVTLAVAFVWLVCYFCVYKGVKSSSYVVWVTVPVPVVFIIVMVLNGLQLPNSDNGIRMYLRGEIDGVAPDANAKLMDGSMWADACGQIFFSLGTCMGVMTSYASYNRRRKPIIGDVMAISFCNCGLSFFAGFAVFSVVGYLKWLGSPVADKVSSSGLAFVAYPAAIETMPFSNLWSMVLALTLFTLGIDTAFSLVEAVSTVLWDTEWGRTIPRKLIALIICVLGFCGSLLFVSSWGYTFFDVVDHYISVYLMLLIGLLECLGAGWVYNGISPEAPVFFPLQPEPVTAKSTTAEKMRFAMRHKAEQIEHRIDENSTPRKILLIVYWTLLVVMGPVTIFALPSGRQWIGILVFWIVMLITIVLTYLLKAQGTTAKQWYEEIFLGNAMQLAYEITKLSRSDAQQDFATKHMIETYCNIAKQEVEMAQIKNDNHEDAPNQVNLVEDEQDKLLQKDDDDYYCCNIACCRTLHRTSNAKSSDSWWVNPFCLWWSFSIKYFIPWALYLLIMWGLKADITLDDKGRGYGGYHLFWQLMGFLIPFIGFLCFIIPLIFCTKTEAYQKGIDSDSDDMGFKHKIAPMKNA